MENVLMRQPNAVQPYCATDVFLYNNDRLIAEIKDNHQAMRTIVLEQPVNTKLLKIKVINTNEEAPVSLFEVRCY